METLFNTLHVAAAVFIVGPMAILPMSALRPIRAGRLEEVASLAKSTRLFTLLSLVVVFLGFGLMSTADPRYDLSLTTPWILISLVLYTAALVINMSVVVPALGKTGAAATRNSYARIAGSSGVVALLLVAVTTLMVCKP